MSNRKWKRLVVCAALGTMSFGAIHSEAQAPAPVPPPGAKSVSAPETRFSAIQQLGLNNPALKLTTEQKARIDEILAAYLAEQNAVSSRYAVAPGAQSSPEIVAARRAAHDKLKATIGGVLSKEQRQTWDAEQGSRRARMEALSSRPIASGGR